MKIIECPECDKGRLRQVASELVGTRKGEQFVVKMPALVCQDCGFKTIPKNLMGQFALLISDEYRRAHQLLTSQQIRDLRARLRMSQKQFADFLHVGIASVKRWELGEVQDAAMNRLIVLSVADELRNREEFSPWGEFEEFTVEEIRLPLEPHPAGLSGLPNGPPPRIGPGSSTRAIPNCKSPRNDHLSRTG